MAAKPSNKSKYESQYGGGWISAGQWLAELMCQRQANMNKKGQLPNKFWSRPEWERAYKTQLLLANGLIKAYSAKAVGCALRRKEGKKVFSLGAKWLDPVVAEEQRRIEQEEALAAEAVPLPALPAKDAPLPNSRPPVVLKKSMLSKLKGI